MKNGFKRCIKFSHSLFKFNSASRVQLSPSGSAGLWSERKGGKGCEDETSQGSKDTPSTRQHCVGRNSEMLRRPKQYGFALCFCLASPWTPPCTVLSSLCTEQHVKCCFTSPANISKLQRRQRARPQPWPGVYGQMECELRVRKKGGSYNEASPLCWLFVWTDRLSHSSSCGWNTNGYD